MRGLYFLCTFVLFGVYLFLVGKRLLTDLSSMIDNDIGIFRK